MLTINDNLADAACRDVSEMDKRAFYTTGGSGHKRAQAICRQCPVQAACLDEALSFEVQDERHGVWGGLTGRERDRLFGEVAS